MAFTAREAARSCFRRARRLLSAAAGDLPATKARNDLRRMALVMAVTALDTYMHRAVLARVSAGRSTPAVPRSLRTLTVPLGGMLDLAEHTIKARSENKLARPLVQVKNVLHRRLLDKTFQSYDEVGEAMAMLGIRRPWEAVGREMGETAEQIRSHLNQIVRRRNQIVHEGDFVRQVRPRRLKLNQIRHQRIKREIDWIESLVDAIQSPTLRSG